MSGNFFCVAAILSVKPIAALNTIYDEPPPDMNGKTTPVIGSTPTTPPKLTNA